MSAIAIIPARGGSKGIPNKNLVSLAGKPLIQWTIDAARQSGRFTHVVVSTDSPDIADAARAMGAAVPFLRPASMSQDDSPTLPVVLHALSHFETETTVLLQPTSPLRTAGDIQEAMALFFAKNRPVLSVTQAKPWLFTKSEDGTLSPLVERVQQRQAAPVVAPNGAIYIALSENLKAGKSWWDNPIGYEMPQERSIDIDTPADLVIAEAILGLSSYEVSPDTAWRMAL